MRLATNTSGSNAGSVLATTMVVTFVLGATLASFLLLTQHQVFANARSQSWNSTMAITESGVEDALQMINKYSGDSTKLLDWASDIQAGGTKADYWVQTGANTYKCVRIIGNPVRARYTVVIDNQNPSAPKIRAEGRLMYAHEYDHGDVQRATTMATVGTAASQFRKTELIRTVEVSTRRDGLWTMAMLVDKGVDLKGNNISTDSFDSADPNASAWDAALGYGFYDPSNRKDNGDIASNDGISDSLMIGNADIMGYLSTGPTGNAEVGPNGSVGSETWVSGGNTGIESGYLSDDMNVRLNDVSLPTTTWFALPDLGNKMMEIDGVKYQHVITISGDYRASTLRGSVYVGPGVNARLLISDNVSLTGQEEIRINKEAQRLTIYMAGESFKITGGGVINETGQAQRFMYFGLPTNTDLRFGGNGSFIGAIYANHADFYLGGGGSDSYDFIGASVTKTVRMNGHYNFHYDEDLANYGHTRGFIPTSWAEL